MEEFLRNLNSLEMQLGGQCKRKLDQVQASGLEMNFVEEEILAAIKDCHSLKAPGPDGFNFSFVKKAWSIMKQDILAFFVEFYEHASFAKGINCTFVALVPKVEGASTFSEFRPISMVGCVYKILAKVLANKFRKVLPEIIGETQAAFIGGKQILDGVLIANEVIDHWKKSRVGRLILKIDFEKAYDCVNWKFLLDMLSKFGCGERWCRWIRACISTSSLSILINGSPTEEIFPQKGLRQGDPISPFLFNVVVEALNIMMERVKEGGFIKGIVVGNNGVNISHLQFADDSIFFCNNE